MAGRVFSFWLDDALIDQVDGLASADGVKRSQVVREAITREVTRRDPDDQPR